MSDPLEETTWVMHSIARGLDDILNEKGKPKQCAFMLMVAPIDAKRDVTNVNYVANIPRAEARRVLQAVLDRWDMPRQ